MSRRSRRSTSLRRFRKGFDWPSLLAKDGDESGDALPACARGTRQEKRHARRHFPQGAEQDPGPGQAAAADRGPDRQEQWSSLAADVKGDAYEGLLEKNAAGREKRRGPILHAAPAHRARWWTSFARARGDDLRSGLRHGRVSARGARLLAEPQPESRPAQKKQLKSDTLFGIELVDSVTRLCAMNLLLHGIGRGRTREILPSRPTTPEGRSGNAFRDRPDQSAVRQEEQRDRS